MNVHILYVPTREVARHDIGVRWCFGCRKRLPHECVVYAPIEMSYYGPHDQIKCSRCHKDRTLFPGYERLREEL